MYLPDPPPPNLTLMLASLAPDAARRLLEAFHVAATAHRGQTRDEGSPFIDHPVRVAEILWSELGCRDVELLIAAVNHDVLEDCDTPDAAFMASVYGRRVTELVEAVTKATVATEDQAARDDAYLAALRHASHEARLLKLADRIDNLRCAPLAGDPDKAERYLRVSREHFLPLALMTSPTAERLIAEACDMVETYLQGLGRAV